MAWSLSLHPGPLSTTRRVWRQSPKVPTRGPTLPSKTGSLIWLHHRFHCTPAITDQGTLLCAGPARSDHALYHEQHSSAIYQIGCLEYNFVEHFRRVITCQSWIRPERQHMTEKSSMRASGIV